MRNNIIAEEELTHKILACLKNNFAVSGLGRSLDVLLEKCIDTLPAVSAVSNLHRMLMSTEMNAGSLRGLLPMDVEDFRLAKSNAFWRLFADPANESRSGWHNTRERERIFRETFKFRVVDLRGTMDALKVITIWILALEMANTSRGTKGKANVVCNIGSLSLSPNMAIILLVHAFQRLGPGLR
jgi:hypothetical protein